MPYITYSDRLKYLENGLQDLLNFIDVNGISGGDLNYLMSTLANEYMLRHGLSYAVASDVVKTFECAKLEFVRQVLDPYEDRKIKQNGSVYSSLLTQSTWS